MIWLASFPRSGNTFFRNVLHDVYGLESSTFDANIVIEEDYARYPVVKTHVLPEQCVPNDPSIKIVYLVRDGRNSVVSLAHHRADIVDENSDFAVNLVEAIVAPHGSYFGGWSEHARQWMARADVIIHFEDLIADPIGQVERLREIMDLPKPKEEALPTFKSQKFGNPRYGSGKDKNLNEEEQKKQAKKFFRRGKNNSWEDELSPDLQRLFWIFHGDMMAELGYIDLEKTNEIPNFPIKPEKPKRVLVDAIKTGDRSYDGVKRYNENIINNLRLLVQGQPEYWNIDLCYGSIIKPMHDYSSVVQVVDNEELDERRKNNGIPKYGGEKFGYEYRLLALKEVVKKTMPSGIYEAIAKMYRDLPVREYLGLAREKYLAFYRRFFTLQDGNYDLIHVILPQHLPYFAHVKSKTLVTVHDLTHELFPEFHEKNNMRLAKRGIELIQARNSDILAVSRATSEDLQKHYGINESRISVVHEAVNFDRFHPEKDCDKAQKIREKYKLPDAPYFISLSTIEPRKNFENTIVAFQKLRAKNENINLVICGKKGWKYDGIMSRINQKENGLYYLGYVPDEHLGTLFSNALALVYVSHYEGFGLPLLEAMACGTTVIYGNNSSMPEVVKNGGLAADANDSEDIEKQMQLLLDDENLLKEKQNLAFKRANQFSWLKAAWETLLAFEKAVEEPNKII